MKSKIISIILIMTMMIGTCSVAVAADPKGNATRDSLKSYGSIEYHKGGDKVVFNSEDLYLLADQIDQVKLDVVDQLEAMNTYFTAGDGINLDTDRYISITHARPSRVDFVDPLSVNFDTLLEGIAASQSVSQDVEAYGYAANTELYINASGALTTDGSEEGATQINISAATAENLSAGTVAWVNGQIILGTGGDNKAYFDKGVENQEKPDNPPDDSSGNVNNAVVTTLSGKSYLVTEDMTDIYLHMYGTTNSIPQFTTLDGDVVAFEEVKTYIHDSLYSWSETHEALVLYNKVYYIPELKTGTTITGFSGNTTRLYTAKDSDQGGTYHMDVLDKTSHLVTNDLKNVFMILDESDTIATPPKFNVQQNVSTIKIKNIGNFKMDFMISIDGMPNNKNLTCNVFYIPRLPAGTEITNIKGKGYIVY